MLPILVETSLCCRLPLNAVFNKTKGWYFEISSASSKHCKSDGKGMTSEKRNKCTTEKEYLSGATQVSTLPCFIQSLSLLARDVAAVILPLFPPDIIYLDTLSFHSCQ